MPSPPAETAREGRVAAVQTFRCVRRFPVWGTGAALCVTAQAWFAYAAQAEGHATDGAVADAQVANVRTSDGSPNGSSDGWVDGSADGWVDGSADNRLNGSRERLSDRRPETSWSEHAVDAGAVDGPGSDAGAPGRVAAVAADRANGSAAIDRSQDNTLSVVTAPRTRAGSAREDIAAAVTVLNPADSPRSLDDLGALLLEVPGANVTRRGGFGAFATVSLRGSNPDEVRIYVDGIPLNQAVGGAVDLSTLPLGDVERVEVYRGSTPIAFGESALGGVVSISTRTPGRAQASARGGVGSFRTAFADATAGGGIGPLRLYVGLHALHALGDFPATAPLVAGGYQPANRENNDLSQLDGVVRAAVSLPGRRELRAGAIGIWRDQGLPAEDIFRSSARAETTRMLGHIDYESRADLGASSRLRAAVFASWLRDAFLDPQHQIVGIATATHDVTRSIGATATAEKALGGWGRLTALGEARGEQYHPQNDNDPSMPAGYPATRRVATAGVELDARSSRLNLDVIPSARLESSHDVRTGRDMFGAQLGPSPPVDRTLPVLRLGLLRPLAGGASLRANVGRYARIPSFVELYGYNRGVLGNPELKPEQGVNADVGLTIDRQRPAGAVAASVTLFAAKVDDLIAWQTHTYQTRPANVSRARIWGLESEVRVRHRRLAVVAQGTLTDARDEGDIAASHDRQLPYHPRARGYTRAEWRQAVSRWGVVLCGYADLDATAGNSTASVFADLPTSVFVGSGLAAEHARSGLRLAASAFNLSDVRVNPFPGYPLPGRSVFVSLGWSSGVFQETSSHTSQE